VTAQVPLLAIERLKVVFQGERGRTTHAVDAVDLTLMRGTTLGIVGESGCGKSVTALAIMGLLSRTGAVSGVVRFDGTDLIRLPPARMRDLRGSRLAMIFQEPMTSLNPSYTIGEQIIESLMRHRRLSQRDARRRAIELLRRVHIPSPEERIDDHPHKLSGGMRQRAMIAMALACGPELLIADEPTTALDVTIQAQILDLLRELRRENRISIILITHDLGVVERSATRLPSCMPARWSSGRQRARCSTTPRIPTRSACSGRCRGSMARSRSLRQSRAWSRT